MAAEAIAGSRMTSGGEIIITARRFRTQEANREDARARLAEMIANAHIVQPSGARPGRAGRRRRGGSKEEGPARGGQGAARGKVELD